MTHVPKIFPQVSELDLEEDLAVFFDPDDDIGLVDEETTDVRPLGFTWQFDFNAHDLDFAGGNPPVVYELGTINEWISHTINTEQFETPIFGSDIGTVINDLIGNIIDSYVLITVEEELTRAINIHDRISAVNVSAVFPVGHNIYGFLSYAIDNDDGSASLIQLR